MAKANHPESGNGLDKVRALQRTLYVAAKRDGQRRFPALFDRILRPDVMRRAWEQVRSNKGAAGIDGETLEAIEAYGVERMLVELREAVAGGKYRPRAVRRVWIPKPGRAEKRPLGIPVVRDRILQTATELVLEPVFEASFLPSSYGFRPKKGAHQALECIRQEVNAGAQWVVDVDFKDFFGGLDQEFLLRLVARRVSDRRVLRLIRLWLLLPRQLGSEVRPGRQLRTRAPRAVRQQEAGLARTELGQAQHRLVHPAGCASPLWERALWLNGDRDHVNTVGEPDEGKPHVRFDEGRLATGPIPDPAAYSTRKPRSH